MLQVVSKPMQHAKIVDSVVVEAKHVQMMVTVLLDFVPVVFALD